MILIYIGLSWNWHYIILLLFISIITSFSFSYIMTKYFFSFFRSSFIVVMLLIFKWLFDLLSFREYSMLNFFFIWIFKILYMFLIFELFYFFRIDYITMLWSRFILWRIPISKRNKRSTIIIIIYANCWFIYSLLIKIRSINSLTQLFIHLYKNKNI